MITPNLYRHGEYLKPNYISKKLGEAGSAGGSTDEDRPDGQVSGIVKRYKKNEQSSINENSFGIIKNILNNSIEYTANRKGLRGLALISGLFCAAMGLGCGTWQLIDNIQSVNYNIFEVIAFTFPFLMLAFGVLSFIWSIRLELFCPEDEPTIFDRKHRKVYRLFRESQPGIRGLFKRWPLRAAEYEWDLIDAEHTATLMTTGSTLMRYHALVFIVRKSATDSTIIDSFNIGNSMILGEQTVAPVWEHIRRFMEENGPHLSPGDTLAPTIPPQTFLQSLAIVSPFGSKYGMWWKEQLPAMILIHVLLPLSLPFLFLWAALNWLSYKTAISIEWPEEVLAAVGSARCA